MVCKCDIFVSAQRNINMPPKHRSDYTLYTNIEGRIAFYTPVVTDSPFGRMGGGAGINLGKCNGRHHPPPLASTTPGLRDDFSLLYINSSNTSVLHTSRTVY